MTRNGRDKPVTNDEWSYIRLAQFRVGRWLVLYGFRDLSHRQKKPNIAQFFYDILLSFLVFPGDCEWA